MNKKLIISGLLIGMIVSSIVSFVKADEVQPVTIIVQVKSLYSNYSEYKTQYDGATDSSNSLLAGTYFRNALGVEKETDWATNADGTGDVPQKKLEPGKFAFGYNQSDVTVSPSISGGYGNYSNKLSLSGVNDSKTYTFKFSDSSNVSLVLAAYDSQGTNAGCVTGKILYLYDDANAPLEELSSWGVGKQNAYGDHWYSPDWYRKDKTKPDTGKAYSQNGFVIKQNSNSSTVEIASTGGQVKSTTMAVTVYIGCSPIKVNLGTDTETVSNTTVDSGVKNVEGPTQASSNNTPVDNGSGTADSYAVNSNYDNQIGIFNNWQVVQSYVNSLIDTITMVSYFYFGIAFLTSILMLIYNIVAIAGATSNPMVRTRLFMRFGISVLCLALLGGSALLARLFILTCMGG